MIKFFLTALTLALVAAVIFTNHFTASFVVLSLLIFIFCIWYFSEKIISKSFPKLIKLEKSPFHSFVKTAEIHFKNKDMPPPTLWFNQGDKTLDVYGISSENNINLIFSENCLKHINPSEFIDFCTYGLELHESKYLKKQQPWISLSIILSKFCLFFESIISFVFGFKTIDGTPKPLLRTPLVKFILGFYRLIFQKRLPADLIDKLKSVFDRHSYLEAKSNSPALSPLSFSQIAQQR